MVVACVIGVIMGGYSAMRRARRTVAAGIAIALAGLVQAVATSGTAHADATGTGGDYVALAQTKLFDSRGTTGPLGSTTSVSIPVLGQGGVPSSGVGAVLVDVTAVNPTGNGYIRLAPADGSTPSTSSLSYNDGQTASNSAVVAPGASGQLSLTNNLGTTSVVVSVEGYFTAAGSSGTAPGGFMPITGTRVLDTRNGTGASSAAPLVANSTTTVAVAGQGDVPANAAAAIVNISELNATANGYLTAWASGTSKPATGSVNYSSTGTISTSVTVPIGTDGNIAIQLSNGSADVVIDVQGYFSAGTTDGSGLQLADARLYDSRTGGHTSIPADGTISVNVGGTNGLPTYAVAGAVLNITAISPQATGTLDIWRAGFLEPSTSQINFAAGAGHSNMQITRPGDSGQISIHNRSAGTVDVTVDLQGWFAAPRAISAADEQAFLTAAENEGTDPEKAQEAVYDTDLVNSIATSDDTVSYNADGSVNTDPQDPADQANAATPEDTEQPDIEQGGTDPDGTTDPDGYTTVYDPDTAGCPSGSHLYSASTTLTSKTWYRATLFKTTFKKTWCGNNSSRHVTKILGLSVRPSISTLGGSLGWDDYGLVASANEDWYYQFGVPQGGHHSQREMKYKRCMGHNIGCIQTVYHNLQMNVHYDGSWHFFR